jgi:hypothetical protein
MKIPFVTYVARLGPPKHVGAIAAALLIAGAIGGWAMSTMLVTSAVAVEELSAFELMRKNDTKKLPLEEAKPSLIGSYAVTGTDPDGKPYVGAIILDIALAPSGALELEWDNGKQVGVGEVIGDVLAVSCLTKGRTAILIMRIHSDGSLSGKWSRRKDRGYMGTETWKKT